MVSPLVRGLLGIEAGDGGRRLTLRAAAARRTGTARRCATWPSGAGALRPRVRARGGRAARSRRPAAAPARRPRSSSLAPALPLDARVPSVDGRTAGPSPGTSERAATSSASRSTLARGRRHAGGRVRATTAGTDVVVASRAARPGRGQRGPARPARAAGGGRCGSSLEGRAGRTYELGVRTPRTVGAAGGVDGRRRSRAAPSLRGRRSTGAGRRLRPRARSTLPLAMDAARATAARPRGPSPPAGPRRRAGRPPAPLGQRTSIASARRAPRRGRSAARRSSCE